MYKFRSMYQLLSLNQRCSYNFTKLQILSVPKFFSTNAKSPISVSKTSSKRVEDDFDDGPIKYSKSPAVNWRAEYTRAGTLTNRLWYEPYVIIASLFVFLVYFTIVREENDIDVELDRTLYSRINGLEEHQLRLSLEYNKENGLDTTDIINRLKEIELEKQQKAVVDHNNE